MAPNARSARAALVTVLMVLGALIISVAPAAASRCGDRVVTDWSDGRVDGIYPLHCYDDAVDGLPEDVRVYSSAADDISRAMQARLHSVAARAPAPEGGAVDSPSLAHSGALQSPPLVLLLLAGSVCAFAIAAMSTWIFQRRRHRS